MKIKSSLRHLSLEIGTHTHKYTVPAPRTKIKKTCKALKGCTKSFEIGVKDNKDPLKQLVDTRKVIQFNLMKQLDKMTGLKFVETLTVTFEKYT